jgi:hypothetical protein
MCVSQTLFEFRMLRKIFETETDEVMGMEVAASWGISWHVFPTLYYLRHKIENNEMGVACSTWGEEETRFCWGNVKEKDNLKDRGINERMMLKWVWSNGLEKVHCVVQDQGRENWLAFVSTVIILGFHKMQGIPWLTDELRFVRRNLPRAVSGLWNHTEFPSVGPVNFHYWSFQPVLIFDILVWIYCIYFIYGSVVLCMSF